MLAPVAATQSWREATGRTSASYTGRVSLKITASDAARAEVECAASREKLLTPSTWPGNDGVDQVWLVIVIGRQHVHATATDDEQHVRRTLLGVDLLTCLPATQRISAWVSLSSDSGESSANGESRASQRFVAAPGSGRLYPQGRLPGPRRVR